MRRDHPTSPFDFEADELQGELADVTDEFWGTTRSWVSREHPTTEPAPRSERGDHATGSMAVIKSGFAAFRPTVRGDASGEIARTRQHGVVRPQPAVPREASLGELASGWFDDDDDWSLPTASNTAVSRVAASQRDEADTRSTGPTSTVRRQSGSARADDLIPLSDRPGIGLGGVDPLLVRLGAIVAAIVMLVPLAMSLRPAEADAVESIPGVAAPAGAAPVAGGEADDASSVEQPTGSDSDPSPQSAVETESTTESVVPASSDSSAAAPVEATGTAQAAPVAEPVAESIDESIAAVTQSESAVDEAATVDAVAERQVPECPQTYEAGVGDSWYRIADAADVSPSALLDENGATLDTVIFPGDEICLPAGATMPSPPTTTEAPATTAPATTAPATTAPPTTAPATTTPASTSEVQQIIRDVFPDELEERALEIAFRESRYDATAYNGWCCYGVFQIYWSVHQGWLDDYGIDTSSDLFDARKNTEAAYALYRSAGGWGPWGG